MKKSIFTIIIAACASLFALTSCQKEPADLLVGSWEMTAVKLTSEGMTVEIDPVELMGGIPTFTFSADGIFAVSVEEEGEVYSESYNYSVVDGDPAQLMLTVEGESMTMTIKQLDNTTLILSSNEDGVSMDMTFTRK